MSERNHDPVGGDVRSGGDAGLGVTDRVGELLEGVLLEVVVVAALFLSREAKSAFFEERRTKERGAPGSTERRQSRPCRSR